MPVCMPMYSLSANQFKEFIPYFNQYATILFLTSQGSKSNMKFTVTDYLYIYWNKSGHFFKIKVDMTVLNVLKLSPESQITEQD